MQDHLPECQLATGVYDDRADCICDALRACEQRVIAEGDEQSQIAYSTGYRHALDAAEKAVADIDGEEMCCACNDDYRMTIAAIRALKEKP